MGDWPTQLQEGKNRGVLTPGSLTPFGDYCDIAGVGYSVTATAWTTANRAVYQPVVVRAPITITDAIVTVQTQNGNLDVGLYTWDNVLIVRNAGVGVGAAGIQIVALTDTLVNPGWYKLGFSCDSTTAVFRGTAVAAAIARVCGFQEQATAYPLPTPTATPTTYATAIAPAVALSYTATI